MLLRWRILWALLGIGLTGWGQAATLSEQAQISVLTCGPGDDLYAAFGHSAFRVQDPMRELDVVYNYGTFDFNTPNFYVKFARGKLLYRLSRQRFVDFLYTYQLESRWVKEQLLDLSPQEKKELFRFLEWNYLPDNREYRYDFLFDNCSTRIPSVLKAVLGDSLFYRPGHLEQRYTFRQLIQQYLETNSWASLGIDLALGAVIDRKASREEHMFLPDYVFRQLENSTLDKESLVQRNREILMPSPVPTDSYFTLSPLFWIILFLLFVGSITFIDYRNQSRSRYLDFVLFQLTGLCGLVLFLLWFFTEHTTTSYNMNLLWAFPLNSIVAFHLLWREVRYPWLHQYMIFLLVCLGIASLLWLFKVQVFSPLLIVLWLALAIRYSFLHVHFK